MVTPYIICDAYDFEQWQLMESFKDLRLEMELLRAKVADVCDYRYSNNHFYVADGSGNLCLQISFCEEGERTRERSLEHVRCGYLPYGSSGG